MADGGEVVSGMTKKKQRKLRKIRTGTLAAFVREHWDLDNDALVSAAHGAAFSGMSRARIVTARWKIKQQEGDQPPRLPSLPGTAPTAPTASKPGTKLLFVHQRWNLSNAEIVKQADALKAFHAFDSEDVSRVRYSLKRKFGDPPLPLPPMTNFEPLPATGGPPAKRSYTRRAQTSEAAADSHDPILDSKLVALRRLILDVGLDKAQGVFDEYMTVRDGIGGRS